MFDALGTPSLGWDLLQQIRKITDQPVRYIVVSHYHADHIYGLQAFKDHSAGIIVAQERAGEYRENEETADERADQRLDQRREALFPWVNRNTRVVPPDITFRQRATLNLGGKRFVLIYAGPAHSASDMMMMVEPDGVLFAGDIVQNSRIPFMNSDDVDTANWLRGAGGGRDPRSQIHHSRPRQAVDRGQASDRIHARLHRTMCAPRWARRWRAGPISTPPTSRPIGRNTRTCPLSSSNNRGNAYRIFLEMEQSQFKEEKPDSTLR